MRGKFSSVLIASDMDGTFLREDGTVSPRNEEKLAYFKENGGSFTFATGRSVSQLLQAVPNAAELCNVPAVTCNGASLYDLAGKRELWRSLIDPAIAEELYAFVEAFGEPVGMRVGTDREFYYSALNNPYIREDAEIWGQGEGSVLAVSEWKTRPIYKIALRGEEGILAKLRPRLERAFDGRLSITQSVNTLIDIQGAGRTKAALLDTFVKDYFDRPMTLCVIGDYDNDLEMLALSDLPCCPSNALDSVKAICQKEFCSCDEGAIADLVDYLDTVY